MLFNSRAYLVFLPIVLIGYYLFPHRLRWIVLLLASCFFYAYAIPYYLLILLITISLDYSLAWAIHRYRSKGKWLLAINITSTLALLFFFKYYDFGASTINHISHVLGWNYSIELLQLIPPIGLSFHTFQGMSYVIDVYRGKQEPEKHPGVFALYVLFFPQLVAGPIERASRMLPQFYQHVMFNYENIVLGARRVFWGLFKKVVIADNLAPLVNAVYEDPTAVSWKWLVIGIYFFAVQIYCDFSGYTDIAIGSARMMGFTLSENFDRPYSATSFVGFWRKWHMSLTQWFRDYIYVPLGGKNKWVSATLVVFLLSGLWHGAAWTFVVWGLLHGTGVIISRFFEHRKWWVDESLRSQWIKRVFIFHAVAILWVFFRAESFHDVFYYMHGILSFAPQPGHLAAYVSGHSLTFLALQIFFCVGFFLLEPFMERRLKEQIPFHPRMARWIFAVLLALLIAMGNWDNLDFIYFQF